MKTILFYVLLLFYYYIERLLLEAWEKDYLLEFIFLWFSMSSSSKN